MSSRGVVAGRQLLGGGLVALALLAHSLTPAPPAAGSSPVLTGRHIDVGPPPPAVSGLSPTSGPAAGGTAVVISGSGFTGASAVDFGGSAAPVTVVSDTEIDTTSPAGTGVVDVRVTAPGGTSALSAADQFAYDSGTPLVTSVSPGAGPTAAGASVTIGGSNLAGVTSVLFGTTPVTIDTVSASSLTVSLPALPPGTADVTVSDGVNTSPVWAADQYSADPAPAITGLSMSSGGAEGGTSLTITGTDLGPATAVSFGSSAAASFTVQSATSILAVSSAQAPALVDITVTSPGGTSATVPADQFTYLPDVTGVSPSAGPLAGGTPVTITGAGFTGLTAASVGGIALAGVTVVSDTTITATTPAMGTPGSYDVVISDAAGSSATGPADRFTFRAVPTVTAVSPGSGPLAGGNSITVHGTGLSGATSVSFGGAPAPAFAVVDDSTLTATAPAQPAGAVDVTVTTPGGTSATGGSDIYDYVNVPAITGVTPSQGPLGGGTVVTISGSDLGGTTGVAFGGIPATGITQIDSATVTAQAPAHAAAAVDITITTAGGTSATAAADVFTYVAAPTVTAVTPASGGVSGGQTVTISGTGLDTVAAVSFGGTSAAFTDVDAGTLTATSPAGTPGTVDITVTGPGGTSATGAADRWTWLPMVTGVTPNAGPVAGGTSVTVTGHGFTGATGATVGGAATSVTVIDDGHLTLITPAHAAASIDIRVVDASGTSAAVAADTFTYEAAPTVSSVSPAKGPVGGGTSVTITGTGLLGASAVSFGANAAASLTVVNATTITATSPAGSAGAIDVIVTAPGGTSTANPGDTFTYVPVPVVSSVFPTAGPTAGGTAVTVSGSGFTNATKVSFGGVLVTPTITDDGLLTATSPAESAATVDITVISPGGTSATSSSDQFTFAAKPTVTAVAPAVGSTGGGDTITVNGTGFAAGTTVSFGSTAAAGVVVQSGTQLLATSPAESAGTVDVMVTTAGGTSTTNAADQYTFQAPPTVTSVSPNAGPLVGGNTVTIRGTNLQNATAVSFGANAATGVTVVNSTTVTAAAPAGVAGTVNITVTTPAGTSPTSAADQYTYRRQPAITSISPFEGPLAGGTTVTVSGARLNGLSSVTVGGVTASFTSVNNTTFTVTTPAAPAGTVDIVATTPGGSSALGPGDQFTYLAVPTVTGVSPAQGPLSPGTAVTVSGTGFTDVSAISVGTQSVGTYTVTSTTSLSFTVPTSATAGAQDIRVTTPGGTSATGGADLFTYVAAPVVSAVNPAQGPLAGGYPITVTGTGFTGATAVAVGGTAATGFSVSSDTSLSATVPAGAAGTVDVVVTTVGGSSATGAADQFTYIAAPTITAVSPAQGPLSGAGVAVTGTGLDTVTAVTVGAHPATFSLISATQLNVVAPAVASPATVDILVTNPGGTNSPAAADQFTYQAVPTVTSVSPSDGPLVGGTTVTIKGTALNNPTQVTFGGVAATSLTPVSATQLTAVTPAGSGSGAVDVVVTTAGGSVTDTSAFTYRAVPGITSLTPAAGPLAGGNNVVIQGGDFTAASAVSFGATAASSFTLDSATQITAVAPSEGAGTVNVAVTTPGGTTPADAQSSYRYAAAPTVSGVAPAAGPTAGGTTITVTGTGFTGATAVTVGGTAASNLAVTNDSSLTVTTPPGSGSGDIVVTAPGGSSSVVAADLFTWVPQPAVTALSPASGPLSGGGSIMITGTNLSGTSAVTFNDGMGGSTAATSVTVLSPTTVRAVIPAAGATGANDVEVTTAGGTSTANPADLYTYMPVPSVSAISPIAGPLAGGTPVTVTGTGFTGATAVNFGATAGTGLTVSSDTTLTITSPAHAPGAVDIRVITPGGTSATSAADTYRYDPVPVITSATPLAGPSSGGTLVTLTGSGFTDATSVLFGTTAAAGIAVSSDTTMTAVTPSEAAGTAAVTVTSPGGTSAGTFSFVFTPAPLITAVSPGAGPLSGGTAVTVSGTGFTGATGVTVGGTTASYTVLSDTSMSVTTPAGAAGAADIIVDTVGGSSAAVPEDVFTYEAAPTVTSVAPVSGSTLGGTTVTVNGTNFVPGATVSFGAAAGTSVTVVSSTQLTVVSPAGAGTVDIVAATPGGSSATSAADQYTFVVPPSVTGISPANGPTFTGTVVTITGGNFTGATGVLFGGVPAPSLTVVSGTTIQATSPVHVAGVVDVQVVTGGGPSAAVPADQFTYIGPPVPVVSAVTPTASVAAGGYDITVSGSGFTAATAVDFGTTAAPTFWVLDDSTISVEVPPGAGTVDVEVVSPGGTSAALPADQFTYVSSPVVTRLDPPAGPVDGGWTLTIEGSNLSTVSAITVAGQSQPFSIQSDQRLSLVMPAEPAGSVPVSLTNLAGSGNPVRVTYVDPPVITAIAPASGSAGGGWTITVAGTDLGSATAVTVGGVPAAFTVGPSGTLSVVVPPLPAGTATVVVTTPGGSNAAGPASILTLIAVVVAPPPPPTSTPGPSTPAPVPTAQVLSLKDAGGSLVKGFEAVVVGGGPPPVESPPAAASGSATPVISTGNLDTGFNPGDVFARHSLMAGGVSLALLIAVALLILPPAWRRFSNRDREDP